MTILGEATFQQPNQSGWNPASDGQNFAVVVGSGEGTPTLNIASNTGTVTTTVGADAVMRLGSGTTASIDALVRFKIGGGNGGLIFRYQNSSNYYRAIQEDASDLYLQKFVGGSLSTITSVGISGWSTTVYWWMHVVMIGSNVSVTVWQDGGSEPSPQIATTDTSISSAGGYGIGSVAYSGGQVNAFDRLLVTDGSNEPGTQTAPRTNAIVYVRSGAALVLVRSGESDVRVRSGDATVFVRKEIL